ncbi:MAG: hypothetical protein RR061_07180 [Muribaculaceae bacterium]
MESDKNRNKNLMRVALSIIITIIILNVIGLILIPPQDWNICSIVDAYQGIEFSLCFGLGFPQWSVVLIVMCITLAIYLGVLRLIKYIVK